MPINSMLWSHMIHRNLELRYYGLMQMECKQSARRLKTERYNVTSPYVCAGACRHLSSPLEGALGVWEQPDCRLPNLP